MNAFRLSILSGLCGAALMACGDADSEPADSTDTDRTDRPSSDAGAGGTDGGGDDSSGTADAAEPYATFDEAWAAYREAVEGNAKQACTCELTWAFFGGSQAGCESQIVNELSSQLSCLEGALRRSEGAGRGWLICSIGPIDAANACFAAVENPGCDDTGCTADEAQLSDCDLLLTPEQSQAIQICENTSSSGG